MSMLGSIIGMHSSIDEHRNYAGNFDTHSSYIHNYRLATLTKYRFTITTKAEHESRQQLTPADY